MKNIACIILLFSFQNFAFAQKSTRLIIRGDDMGYTHSGNEALIKAYRDGIEKKKSIEVIVPSPWFPEAVKLLKENPGVDVGIHLALTSEWENIKWRPLSDCKSLMDSNGYFYPMVYPNKNYPGQAIMENQWKIEDVEKEFRAQIELALKLIPGITHISSHMNCTGISPEVQAMTKRLAKEYHIDIDPADYGVAYMGYLSPDVVVKEKVKGFLTMLDGLEPGKTYLFIEHPGINNDELQAVYHIGYENVAEHRQTVTDIFTSEEVKKALKQKGIQLISYGDLKK